jgi:malate dehydrogenase (oxaloacetate-decarboxylating)(NADP+)
MDEFMEEFMVSMKEVFPQLLVQFEDFSTDNAFKYLDIFRNRYRCFNDDVCCMLWLSVNFFAQMCSQIQGTGAVVLSGFMNAARLASAASGLPLTDHKILFLGAGSAGIGVAKQLMSFFTLLGLSEEEAKSRIYVSRSPMHLDTMQN